MWGRALQIQCSVLEPKAIIDLFGHQFVIKFFQLRFYTKTVHHLNITPVAEKSFNIKDMGLLVTFIFHPFQVKYFSNELGTSCLNNIAQGAEDFLMLYLFKIFERNTLLFILEISKFFCCFQSNRGIQMKTITVTQSSHYRWITHFICLFLPVSCWTGLRDYHKSRCWQNLVNAAFKSKKSAQAYIRYISRGGFSNFK